ncbi:glycosyltransferase family 4 protein [Peristeroidobacter agariperforans]|uniref:glycosyltransferase family 4 protein n=1 Tax=Peristeroidobacter agariperforans TaxID=268404 RepID=UPI0018E564BF|nr:glycosyltransferase family 4 protein [Peristeroidobacter agariperforans]
MSSARRTLLLVVRWPVGGIRTYLKYTYKYLDPAEIALTIVAPDLAETDQLAKDLAQYQPKVVRTSSNPSARELSAAVLAATKACAFTVIHSHGLTAGLAAVPASKLRRITHVCTLHDVFRDDQFRGRKGALKRLAIRWGLQRIDVLHAVGRDAGHNLLEFAPALRAKPAKTKVIANGIDLEQIDRFPHARDVRAEIQCGPDTVLIGFFGRFMFQKGFRYLVQAVGKLAADSTTRKQLMIVAVGSGGFIREEQEWLRQMSFDRFVRFLPFEPSIVPTMRGVDVIAIPSVWEAAPLLPMEALVVGKPIIGTSCIGLKEVLEGTPSLVAPPMDAAAFATRIVDFLDNSVSLAEHAERYVPQARARFDVSTAAREMRAMLFDGK